MLIFTHNWPYVVSRMKRVKVTTFANRAGTMNRHIGLSVDIQKKNDYRYENSKIGYF